MFRYVSLSALLFFASQPSFAAWYCSAVCEEGQSISLSAGSKGYKYVTAQGDNPVIAFNNLIIKCPGFIFNGVLPDTIEESYHGKSAFAVNATLVNSCVESK